MERLVIPPKTETELRNMLYDLMDKASPLPITLEEQPTTENKILKEGQTGIYGSYLYKTINGTTYKTPLTAV